MGRYHLPDAYRRWFTEEDEGVHVNPLNPEDTHHPLDGPWGKAAYDFYISPCGDWGPMEEAAERFDEQQIMDLCRFKEGTELEEANTRIIRDAGSSAYELITTIFPTE